MIDDLSNDLDLSKEKTEVLGSRLRQYNLLAPGVKVTAGRTGDRSTQGFFTPYTTVNMDNPIRGVYCNNIPGLFRHLSMIHQADEWRLFMDASNASFKAVLLHNTNQLPSIPLYYAVGDAERREVIEQVLDKIKYNLHQWKVCSDLKMVAVFLGITGGNAKYPCFICQWDHGSKYDKYNDPAFVFRGEPEVGKFGQKYMPLIDRKKVMIPPLHVKLGVVTNFLKTLTDNKQLLKDQNTPTFDYLKTLFGTAVNDSKIKAGMS